MKKASLTLLSVLMLAAATDSYAMSWFTKSSPQIDVSQPKKIKSGTNKNGRPYDMYEINIQGTKRKYAEYTDEQGGRIWLAEKHAKSSGSVLQPSSELELPKKDASAASSEDKKDSSLDASDSDSDEESDSNTDNSDATSEEESEGDSSEHSDAEDKKGENPGAEDKAVGEDKKDGASESSEEDSDDAVSGEESGEESESNDDKVSSSESDVESGDDKVPGDDKKNEDEVSSSESEYESDVESGDDKVPGDDKKDDKKDEEVKDQEGLVASACSFVSRHKAVFITVGASTGVAITTAYLTELYNKKYGKKINKMQMAAAAWVATAIVFGGYFYCTAVTTEVVNA